MLALATMAGPVQGDGAPELIEVGVSRVNITPDVPIMLSGYAMRNEEATQVEQPLYVRALAFGSDEQGPAVLIVADVLGVSLAKAEEAARRIEEATGIPRDRIAILATHTHSGPVIGRHPSPQRYDAAQRARIQRYAGQLIDGIHEAAVAALADREPASVSWGVGEVGFAANRRVLEGGRWVGFGVNPDGPVDHDLPLLRVTDPAGSLRAALVGYACHATTDDPMTNTVHGDWPGAAAGMIEREHEGAYALIAIGCGGDANPEPRSDPTAVRRHAAELVAEVRRLLEEPLTPLGGVPDTRFTIIGLPLEEETDAGDAIEYPVQVWRFGERLAMVNLGGEVTSGYALRLKRELDGQRLWVNAYANAYPGYVVTARELEEGGYEADSFLNRYGARHAAETADLIVATVTKLVGPTFAAGDVEAASGDGGEKQER